MKETISTRLHEKLDRLIQVQEKGEFKGAGKAVLGSAAIGAGVGHIVDKGFKAGAVAGAKIGLAAALIAGGSRLAFGAMSKAKENGPEKAKATIRSTVSRLTNSDKLNASQKATVKRNGQIAIEAINRGYKGQKHESLESKPASLGKSILERLDSIITEETSKKKAAVGGAIGGAVVGHKLAKAGARKNVADAINAKNAAKKEVKAAAQNTKAAVNNSGAAKTILNKETRLQGQLAKKQSSGIVDKLKNHGAKLAQKGRVKAAANNVASAPNVSKALTKQYAAQDKYHKAAAALKDSKAALRKVGKVGGGAKGALIGAGLGVAAVGAHKLMNKNK